MRESPAAPVAGLVDSFPLHCAGQVARGKPWTSNAIRCSMRHMRERAGLPAGLVAHSDRHAYALVSGTDPAMLAELLGRGDLKMILQNYGQLDQCHAHLRKAADAVKRIGWNVLIF